jgi:hypothetical protein
MPEVDNFFDDGAGQQQFTERRAGDRRHEPMWEDVGKEAVLVQKLQPTLNEEHVFVEIELLAGLVSAMQALKERQLIRQVFGQDLDSGVGRVPNDNVKPAPFGDDPRKRGMPVEGTYGGAPVDIRCSGWEYLVICRVNQRVAYLNVSSHAR